MVILSIPIFIAIAIGIAKYFDNKRKNLGYPYSFGIGMTMFIAVFAGLLGSFFVAIGFEVFGEDVILSRETYSIERMTVFDDRAIAIDTGEELLAIPGDREADVDFIDNCDKSTLTITHVRTHELMPDWMRSTQYDICKE